MPFSENPQFEPLPAVSEHTTNAVPSIPPGVVENQESHVGVGTLAPVAVSTENPPWNGWDVLLIAAMSFVTILVLQFAILLGAHFIFYPGRPLSDLAQQPILLLLSQFLIDGAVAVFLVLLVEGKYHVQFWNAIRWNWPKSGWKLLGLGAAMLLALSVLENYIPMPKDTPFEKLFSRPRDAYLIAIIAVTLGPLVEELFFRGFFYPVLAKRWGATWAILLTALPFAAMHMPQYGYAWGALLVIFVVGVVCGIVRAVTLSVGASFLVHVGYNGTQMLIAVLWTRGFTHMPQGLLHLFLR